MLFSLPLIQHRERCGLFVRFSQLLRKRSPFPNNLMPGIHLVHFGAFTFSPSSTSRRLLFRYVSDLML